MSEAGSRVLVIVVAEESIISSILDEVYELLEALPGVVFASPVHVLRPERF